MAKQSLAVYIGRFSPFHLGHTAVIEHMLKNHDYGLIIIGSARQPRSVKNPWTAAERASIISEWLRSNHPEALDRITIKTNIDVPYNDTIWLKNTNELIEQTVSSIDAELNVVLTGADRDASTYYLDYFPKLTKDLVYHDEQISKALSATIVRDIYFGGTFNDTPVNDNMTDLLLKAFLPPQTNSFLDEFKLTAEFQQLQREHEFIKSYRKSWEAAPYPPVFVTVDAAVVQSGNILLIERKAEPGKGLFALPGGFINQNERLTDAMIRELREETKLKIPTQVLKGSIVKREIFDQPERSLRGRTITVAFLIKLNDSTELPAIKGSDDAKQAMWVPLSQVESMREKLFEDHADIIDSMLGSVL
jgi:bifunctional NMN adenylyltransferase/nudix hydrolase